MTTSYHLPDHHAERPKSMTTAVNNVDRAATKEAPIHNEDAACDIPPPPTYSPTKSEYRSNIVAQRHQNVPIYLAQHDTHDRGGVYNEHHDIALRELTNRRATPPPFPSALPDRLNDDNDRHKKQQRRRKVLMLILAGITFALLTIIIALGVLFGMSKQMNGSAPQPSQGNFLPPPPSNGSGPVLVSAGTKTVTIERTKVATYTVSANTTTTTLSSDTTTRSIPHFLTITIDPLPSSPSPLSSTTTTTIENQNENQEKCNPSTESDQTFSLSLSPQYCLFLSPCNATTANIQSNDCLDFCNANFGTPTSSSSSSSPYKITFQNTAEENKDRQGYQNLCDNLDEFASSAGDGNGDGNGDQDDVGAMTGRIKSCCGKCGCFGG